MRFTQISDSQEVGMRTGNDGMILALVAVGVALLLGMSAGAAADQPPLGDDPRNSGWRATTDGDWQGTGENFGRGWRRDGSGVWQGTGDNFGRGWRPSSAGGWSGTGDNFGRGWEPLRR